MYARQNHWKQLFIPPLLTCLQKGKQTIKDYTKFVKLRRLCLKKKKRKITEIRLTTVYPSKKNMPCQPRCATVANHNSNAYDTDQYFPTVYGEKY